MSRLKRTGILSPASFLITSLTVFLSYGACADSSPYGECRAGYWTSNRNLDDQREIEKVTCFINWKYLGDTPIRLNVNARAGWSDVGQAQDSSARLREGHLESDIGPWTFRLGRQIIAWGRADKINPTDYLSPRNFTALVPEDDEQRIGIDALLGRYQLDGGKSVSLIVAKFEPHEIPEGSLPTNRTAPTEPNTADWAAKLDQTSEDLDWSISYFDGRNRSARYWLQTTELDGIVFRSFYERQRALGADLAMNAGDWALRTELSVAALGAGCDLCDLPDRRIYRWVLGTDRNFTGTANINLQLYVAHRTNYQDGQTTTPQPVAAALDRLNSEFSPWDLWFTYRVADTFYNERIRLELGGIADIENNSGALRPRVKYDFSDSFNFILGSDIFFGPEQSFFGARRKNQATFIELAIVF